MRQWRTKTVVAGILAALTLACDEDTTTPNTGEVNVYDDFFSPELISRATGSTVNWTWRGSVDHNVTFEDDMWNSTDKTTGTHMRTFTASGNYRSRCTIHSTDFDTGMVGEVIVIG
jgi:plastocyanin